MKPSTSVSFRFLRAVTNQITGDTTTVAVVQWDGATLKFDQDADVLGSHPARGDVQKVLRELQRVARTLAPNQARTDGGLDGAFPVDLTTGGVLRWSEKNKGLTPDPERHFSQLVTLSGLHSGKRHQRHVGRKQVGRELRGLGKRLVEAHPGRIRIDTEVQGHYKYVPPLSWKNGRWHHSVAWSFDVEERTDAENRLKSLIGALETNIPGDDAALVAYAPPRHAEIARFVAKELEYVAAMGKNRRAHRLERLDTSLDVSSLEQLVRGEVSG